MRGIRSTSACEWSLVPDQPRTCGEYFAPGGRRALAGGSAPHMRGIHFTVMGCSRNGGISPAHAGNTMTSAKRSSIFWDQPRTCGEYVPGHVEPGLG